MFMGRPFFVGRPMSSCSIDDGCQKRRRSSPRLRELGEAPFPVVYAARSLPTASSESCSKAIELICTLEHKDFRKLEAFRVPSRAFSLSRAVGTRFACCRWLKQSTHSRVATSTSSSRFGALLGP